MSSGKAIGDFLVAANRVANPLFDWTAKVAAAEVSRDTDTLSLSFSVSAATHISNCEVRRHTFRTARLSRGRHHCLWT
jgi:hypothetical protein